MGASQGDCTQVSRSEGGFKCNHVISPKDRGRRLLGHVATISGGRPGVDLLYRYCFASLGDWSQTAQSLFWVSMCTDHLYSVVQAAPSPEAYHADSSWNQSLAGGAGDSAELALVAFLLIHESIRPAEQGFKISVLGCISGNDSHTQRQVVATAGSSIQIG